MTTNPESWHLRKELSVGTILSLATLAIAGTYAFAELKSEVVAVAEQKVDQAQVVRIEERQKQLKADVEQIKRKVEVLPEIRADLRNLVRELEQQRAEDRQRNDRERNGGY